MSDPFAHGSVPRGALLGMLGLALAALVGAGVSRTTGIGVTTNLTGSAVEVRDLRFIDQADGSIAVFNDALDQPATRIPAGAGGFIRGILRGMSRGRKLGAISSEAPYRLTRWDDGRMTVSDPATGHSIDLGAFGPDNYGIFRQLFLDTAPAMAGLAATDPASSRVTRP